MLNILINGINGKMGTVVASEIQADKELNLLGGNISNIPEKPDVIIDFSAPEATISILNYALKNNIPIVIATTGFSKDEQNKIIDASKYIPVFQSSNMSFEIALMAKLLASVSKQLDNSDIEIVETHHNQKKDAPSGTAILLADSINKANNNKYHYNFNRFNTTLPRSKMEIGFSSVRGGNITRKASGFVYW